MGWASNEQKKQTSFVNEKLKKSWVWIKVSMWFFFRTRNKYAWLLEISFIWYLFRATNAGLLEIGRRQMKGIAWMLSWVFWDTFCVRAMNVKGFQQWNKKGKFYITCLWRWSIIFHTILQKNDAILWWPYQWILPKPKNKKLLKILIVPSELPKIVRRPNLENYSFQLINCLLSICSQLWNISLSFEKKKMFVKCII